MTAPHFEPLTGLDAWFLYLERPEAPLHIGGVYVFEGGSRVPGGRGVLGIADTIEERLELVPRYRQRVQFLPFNLGHPVWVDDPDFDLSYHVRRAALPRPGDAPALRDYAARVFARPLDLEKPPWEMTLVEGLEGGRVAVIHKVHHSMVDGMSSVEMGTLLFDIDPAGSLTRDRTPERTWRPRRGPDQGELVRANLAQLSPLKSMRDLAQTGLRRTLSGALDSLVHSPWSGAASLAFSLVRPSRQLFFNRRIGPHRRVHHLQVPLQRVKEVKNAFGGSVNDVILAIVAEGVGRWLAERGESVPDTIRAFCPVSVRDDSARYQLGNQVSGMVVELPTGALPPLTRLGQISAATGDLKRSRQAIAAQGLTSLTGFAPATLQAMAGRLLTGQPQWVPQSMVNMVITNVPGPQFPFYTGGAELQEVWPLVPIYHSMALNIALFSYNGVLHFGLLADRDLVPDLDFFAAHLTKAAADYQSLARRLGPDRGRLSPARQRGPASTARAGTEGAAAPPKVRTRPRPAASRERSKPRD